MPGCHSFCIHGNNLLIAIRSFRFLVTKMIIHFCFHHLFDGAAKQILKRILCIRFSGFLNYIIIIFNKRFYCLGDFIPVIILYLNLFPRFSSFFFIFFFFQREESFKASANFFRESALVFIKVSFCEVSPFPNNFSASCFA